MKKGLLFKIATILLVASSLMFVGCEKYDIPSEYECYFYANGDVIKYENVSSYFIHDDGMVELVTNNKKIYIYSPGNVTIVSKGAIPNKK